jgi:hypothetical protein
MNQVNKITTSFLLPALVDGQVALVLDSKLQSKQWHADWPISERAIPIVEPAMVLGITDRFKLITAAREYWLIGDQVLDLLTEEFPETLQGFAMPWAATKELECGTLFSWPLIKAWGLDDQLTPSAGLSQEYLAFALSNNHAKRLLNSASLNFGGRSFDSSKRVAQAVFFSPPRLIDTLFPWIEFAMHWQLIQKASTTKVDDFQEELKSAMDVLYQIKETLDLLKVFDRYSSFTYQEDKVWVTHTKATLKEE